MTESEWATSDDPERMLRCVEYFPTVAATVERATEILTRSPVSVSDLYEMKSRELADAFEFGGGELRELMTPHLSGDDRERCFQRINFRIRSSGGTIIWDPSSTKDFVHSTEKLQRFRLFAYRCCKVVEHLITDALCHKAFVLSGLLADGRATEEERQPARADLLFPSRDRLRPRPGGRHRQDVSRSEGRQPALRRRRVQQ